jgi:DNA-binding XRE family transcriptional regulator
MTVDLPDNISDILKEIHKKLKKRVPDLTMDTLIAHIIGEWLEGYKRHESVMSIPKANVELHNNLREAIKVSGKSQAQIARELGINKTYLNHVISGRCVPSVTLTLLLAEAVKCPNRIDLLFSLKPVQKD